MTRILAVVGALTVAAAVVATLYGIAMFRDPQKPRRGPYGTVRLDVRPLSRDRQPAEFV